MGKKMEIRDMPYRAVVRTKLEQELETLDGCLRDYEKDIGACRERILSAAMKLIPLNCGILR